MVRAAARIGILLLAAVFPHSRAAAQHTDAAKCDLPAVLAQAGVRANELVTNLQNFTAQERIEFRMLDRVGNQYDAGSSEFDYNAVLLRQGQGYTVQETRNPVPGSRPFPIAMHDLGLPEVALMFLPEFQTNYEMTCSGAVMKNDRLTWIINLRQRIDRPDTTASFTAKNGVVYPAPLKGRAWVAKDSGELVHLDIALMHPVPLSTFSPGLFRSATRPSISKRATSTSGSRDPPRSTAKVTAAVPSPPTNSPTFASSLSTSANAIHRELEKPRRCPCCDEWQVRCVKSGGSVRCPAQTKLEFGLLSEAD